MMLRNGAEVLRNGHRLPQFKIGLFYSYTIWIDSNTGILRATSSAGLDFSFNFGPEYFKERTYYTFGVWGGMSGMTVRNIKKNDFESGVNTRDRKGLKVGLLLASG